MRRLVGSLVIPAALAVLSAVPASATINWYDNDLDRAEREAKIRGKPLLVYFYTAWCSWCLEYENKVFTDDEVTDRSNFFTPVRIEYDVRGRNKHLIDRFKVSSYPTILAISTDGKLLGRLGAYRPVPAFLRFLDESLTPGESLADLDARIEAGERSPALLLRSGDKNFDASELDLAEQRYRAAAEADPDGKAGIADDARIGLAKVRSYRNDVPGALEQYRAVLRGYPDSDRLPEAFVGAISLLREENRLDDVDKMFSEFGDRFPDDPAVLNDHARRLLDAGKETPVALRKAARAVEVSPESADYRATLARAQLASGRGVEALETITAAIERKPGDKDFRVLRLEILEVVRKRPDTAAGDARKPGKPDTK